VDLHPLGGDGEASRAARSAPGAEASSLPSCLETTKVLPGPEGAPRGSALGRLYPASLIAEVRGAPKNGGVVSEQGGCALLAAVSSVGEAVG